MHFRLCVSIVSMKVLVAFLLSVLGCRLAEGRLVSKCELLETIGNLPAGVKPRSLTPDLVAKIVCHVELVSGFNTSVILMNPEPGRPGRPGRPVDSSESSESSEGRRTNSNRPKTTTKPPQGEKRPTLYGLFQLSNLLACSDNVTHSADICSLPCNNFVDDDITDDIDCLLQICSDLIEHGFGGPRYNKLKEWIKLIFQPECSNLTSREYFKECVQP